MAGDIRCGRKGCGRRLSSGGKEIGLAVWDPKKGKCGRWITVCATPRCAGVPMDTKVSELQNYWLEKGVS